MATRKTTGQEPPGRAGRGSLEKMMEILDLFDGRGQRWTPENMMQRLACPRSTLYRHLRVLLDAGLVSSLPDIGYTLGPRIAELDYEMRSSDPLIGNGRPLLQALVRDIPGVGLLCRYYKDRVLCIHQEGAATDFNSGYERGRAMPLARGAASRAILAHIKLPHLREIYERQSKEFAQVGLGKTFADLQEHLRQIRKQEYCVTHGEVTPGVVGIAAAVRDGQGEVIGSLSITVAARDVSERRMQTIADRVAFAATAVTHAMRTNTRAPSRAE
ncbi:MAG: IclR family transcriptional regulator [Betaproteobacteria bacterium RBG_16_64_9]|nr:MAG: IclR family transcriptional regulator [Betaproteobacteria bacterium RBG_16_64_9]